MAINIRKDITLESLVPKVELMFSLSAAKIKTLEKTWQISRGTPVFTAKGKYTTRGWTEWTEGFQYGSALLQFDATGDAEFLALGRKNTHERMATHVSHIGVHDHGFNNVSTYGNLWRLMQEKKIPENQPEREFYELALKISGAVQASRWTEIHGGLGYIYSFNGPHSLFIDTVRTLRSLTLAHQLGHVLMGEKDRKISLLDRSIQHLLTTAKYSIYYGAGRDAYDEPGRTAHESIFNLKDGTYRCPSSQQGYSPFSTWTRGLAWAICGFAEELEFLNTIPENDEVFLQREGKGAVMETLERAAIATADFYIEQTPTCGIPIWDTGAPNLCRFENYLDKPADPFNKWEPVDSSAAVIAAQGFLRLAHYLKLRGQAKAAKKYEQTGLTISATLMDDPYLSRSDKHEGLLLHSVYHRPNGWDYIQKGQFVPNGESSMWGDYHLRELGLLLLKQYRKDAWLSFFHSPAKP
ncbi:MAG: glycosyl hydrolase [Verrucomicrobiales bacterium]